MTLKPYNPSTKIKKGGGLQGMKILKPGSKLSVYQPNYKKGATVFRPVPGFDAAGNVIPWRDADGNIGLSWFAQDATIKGWGIDSKITAFFDCLDPETWPDGSPFKLFYDDMRYHAQYKESMFAWPSKGYAPMTNPATSGFLKGILIENSGKSYNKNPIWGVVLMMSASASDALYEMIKIPAEVPGVSAATLDDPHGYIGRYMHGNPVSLDNGLVLEFDNENKMTDAPGGVNLDGDSSAATESGEKAIPSYACRPWKTSPKLPIQSKLERLIETNESFEDAFYYMTGEEQLRQIIASYGKSAKEAVMYTFGNSEFMPKSFSVGQVNIDMGAAATQTQAQVPAQPAVAPAQAPVAAVPAQVPAQPAAAPAGANTLTHAYGGPINGGVNLDAGDAAPAQVPTEEAPWEDPAVSAPVAQPQQTTTEVTDSIKARLASMNTPKPAI